jgi:hypothetical protein
MSSRHHVRHTPHQKSFYRARYTYLGEGFYFFLGQVVAIHHFVEDFAKLDYFPYISDKASHFGFYFTNSF